ncbi:hypothetical protein DYB31_015347 [Aphanomyces astaci]|uniref:Uncharacterized protein n=1 Tax=Aphanomyces astaci TaxID=112090 RepID=A0A397EMC5_APHAT|nr:hypothetical protein DYB31_015347 [Aphanomyces astaci]
MATAATIEDYSLMWAPSSVDQLRENLMRLEQRWKSMRQRQSKNRPVSVSPAMRPPSPLYRSYSEVHVDSNAYATPPSKKSLVMRTSSPDLIAPSSASDDHPSSSYSTPYKSRRSIDPYDSPVSVSSSSSRPIAGSSRLPMAPVRRVAALTRENVSRLPQYPLHHDMDRHGGGDGGSVCSSISGRSRMSVKTDGGAVFSRLYQPNHLQARDLRMSMHKERQQNATCPFMPRTNVSRNRTPSVASRDSFCSASSCTSTQTDITQGLSASSRLYDPDYIRKRHAKLEKLRQERELRECTFAPAVNKNVNEKLLNQRDIAAAATRTVAFGLAPEVQGSHHDHLELSVTSLSTEDDLRGLLVLEDSLPHPLWALLTSLPTDEDRRGLLVLEDSLPHPLWPSLTSLPMEDDLRGLLVFEDTLPHPL